MKNNNNNFAELTELSGYGKRVQYYKNIIIIIIIKNNIKTELYTRQISNNIISFFHPFNMNKTSTTQTQSRKYSAITPKIIQQIQHSGFPFILCSYIVEHSIITTTTKSPTHFSLFCLISPSHINPHFIIIVMIIKPAVHSLSFSYTQPNRILFYSYIDVQQTFEYNQTRIIFFF